MTTSTASSTNQVASLDKVRTEDGVSIAYQISGNGSCTVLALHGWGGAGTGHSWREVIRACTDEGEQLGGALLGRSWTP